MVIYWSSVIALFMITLCQWPQSVTSLRRYFLHAQAITDRPTFFVEVLHNGSRVPLPGCQNEDWSCTLEAFLVNSSRLCCGYLFVKHTMTCSVADLLSALLKCPRFVILTSGGAGRGPVLLCVSCCVVLCVRTNRCCRRQLKLLGPVIQHFTQHAFEEQ